MPLKIHHEGEADPTLVGVRCVAVIGYGNQGRAHAQNLRDSGVSVVVGLGPDSRSAPRAREDGFRVFGVAEASRDSDLVMLLTPDEVQPRTYEAHIAPHLSPGDALAFAHGFSVHFGLIAPPPEVDVLLIAPIGPGHQLRTRYLDRTGVPCLVAARAGASPEALPLAISYAAALGAGPAGIIETTFAEECVTDLFGEQAVICGGLTALIRAGFETLVEAGYPEELAYFECAHQMKLLADLVHERGVAGMRDAISNTAKYGDLTRGPRVIDAATKARMREILQEIERGDFAREWLQEHAAGSSRLAALLDEAGRHPLEAARERVLSRTRAG